MKREGQLNTQTFNNLVDSTPIAGIFTKVSPSKPTNHSKFTGKCGQARYTECHLHPSCKSSEKSKGSKILKAQNDDVSRLGMRFTSSTASEMLAHLAEEVDEDVVDFDQEMEFMDGGDDIEIDEEKKMDGADEIEIVEEKKMDGADEIEVVEEKKMDGADEIEVVEEKKMDGADEIEVVEDKKMDGADEIEVVEDKKMDGADEDETTSFSEFGYFWEHIEGEDS